MHVSVTPKKGHLLALPAIPLAVGYATYIVSAIIWGIPTRGDIVGRHGFWLRIAVASGALSALWIGWTLWIVLSRGYWRLDDKGITRGKLSPVTIPWVDIESIRIGMPLRRHLLDRLQRHNPHRAAKAMNQFVQNLRDHAVVLRIRGQRVIAINVRPANNGETFMAAIRDRCESKRIASEFSDQEARALSRVRCFHEFRVLEPS
jgi:hypothetical protein